jgi:hypothetical protein
MMVFCVLVAVVMGAGCGVARDGEAMGTFTDEVQVSGQPERATVQLPLRSEDLVDMAAMQVSLNAACPAPTTCTGFGSCASWSSFTACGTAQCGAECARCIKPSDPICTTGIKSSTFTSRFRACFNAAGQQCTEFQVVTSTVCQITGTCCNQNPGVCGEQF